MRQARNELRILIVDQLEMTRLQIRKALLDLGFSSVTEASTGREALAKFESASRRRSPFDLVFMQWPLVDMTGQELLVQGQEKKILQNVPIMMISSDKDSGAIKEALAFGVSEYVVRPFTAEQIFQKLRRHGLIKVAA